jgi:hypothetical protein
VNLSFDPGALLARSYPLARGPRVRLRLARPHDAPAIRALMERRGLQPEELEIARLVRFDPRTRVVICALALVDSIETVVGLGAIDLVPGGSPEPDSLLVDQALTDGLDDLLTRALRGRAGALARTRAA